MSWHTEKHYSYAQSTATAGNDDAQDYAYNRCIPRGEPKEL